MFLRITFTEGDVVHRGKGELVIQCQSHQNPKLPVYAATYEKNPHGDGETDKNMAKDARYLCVSPRGGLKLGENNMRRKF